MASHDNNNVKKAKRLWGGGGIDGASVLADMLMRRKKMKGMECVEAYVFGLVLIVVRVRRGSLV